MHLVTSVGLRVVDFWRHGPGYLNCAFVNMNLDAQGMLGLDAARVQLLFSFTFCGKFYPYTLVHWFSKVGDSPDEDTGMWTVHHNLDADGSPATAILQTP